MNSSKFTFTRQELSVPFHYNTVITMRIMQDELLVYCRYCPRDWLIDAWISISSFTTLLNQKCTKKTDSKNAFVISFQNVFSDLNLIACVDYKPGLQTVSSWSLLLGRAMYNRTLVKSFSMYQNGEVGESVFSSFYSVITFDAELCRLQPLFF